MQIQTINDLAVKVAQDPDLQNKIKDNPTEAIANIAALSEVPNTLIYRMVVGSLGLTVLLTVIGAIVLVATNKGEIPASIIALGSTAIGALAGLLSPAPR